MSVFDRDDSDLRRLHDDDLLRETTTDNSGLYGLILVALLAFGGWYGYTLYEGSRANEPSATTITQPAPAPTPMATPSKQPATTP